MGFNTRPPVLPTRGSNNGSIAPWKALLHYSSYAAVPNQVGEMDALQTLADIAEIIGAGATVVLTFIIFDYTKKRELFESTAQIQTEWQVHNQIILSDTDLLAMETEMHPFGQITSAETKRMYAYFLKLNLAFNSWVGQSLHVDEKLATSTINNTINCLYSDRAFIRTHVFPRGYPHGFTQMIEEKWKQIEARGGKPLPMI
ncbi:hypothetical protein GOL69_19880 [Sinorhizobium medicae]|nr:hypothetical protein [Sinorhizobium medicae]